MDAIRRALRTLADILFFALAVAFAFMAIRFAWFKYYRAAYPLKYFDEVIGQSEAMGVSPALLFAVIRTESSFDPNAQSGVPARGLMQLTQETFEWVRWRLGEEDATTYEDMFNPEINIRYGTELLRFLKDELGSDLNTLCAYHAGRGRALEWLRDPEYSSDGEITSIPFGDTSRYVEKVLDTRRIYAGLYDLD